ncbi:MULTISPECIES: hypothetical protein [Devosia]|uniref:Addiction module component n=1 Tax=Devosia equisanguinis TaxID=2490941 RepID=A0A447IDE7_9HYPH|nr:MULTISPECIES: hypothetical protein [Devosia]ODT51037.1 MAG: hypothetical protein ABS74_01580 [Pelagibacterium sp. SCN 63-126]ODU86794.1 MAG: hypothetical protein ABT14_07640 [Pelagibacterium sp. SCN 63-17]OJX44606.1 MAG: hypothetical protein BGO80_02745 [Devosia sp. 63-57]VDS05514.1 hypothetical protein DEVEQU_02656 [Devosia equisanguinis]
MNKIVRQHYPVENLPEDLRELVSTSSVTVILTEETYSTPPPLSREQAVALMKQMQRDAAERGETVTTEEAVARIRALRDEWDD